MTVIELNVGKGYRGMMRARRGFMILAIIGTEKDTLVFYWS